MEQYSARRFTGVIRSFNTSKGFGFIECPEAAQIYEKFHNSTEARTCPSCGELHPGKGKPPEGWVQL